MLLAGTTIEMLKKNIKHRKYIVEIHEILQMRSCETLLMLIIARSYLHNIR